MNRAPDASDHAASSRVNAVLLSTRYEASRSVVAEQAPRWNTAENFPNAAGFCASLERSAGPST